MRNAFFQAIYQRAAYDDSLFFISGDLGFSFIEPFIKQYPTKFLNAGVAEQNMIGVAAGLAMTGKKVFVYSIVPFVTMRCYEQVRNDIGYQKLPVIIVGTGGGLSYSSLGATHHALEDVALMSSIPGMTVFTPSSKSDVENLMPQLCEMKTPAYLRLDKHSDVCLQTNEKPIALDGMTQFSQGADVVCFGVGSTLDKAARAKEILEKNGYSVSLVSINRAKPLNPVVLQSLVSGHRAVFVFEDHNIIGGVGQVIGSFIAEHSLQPIAFKAFGYPDNFAAYAGSVEYLRTIHGLNIETIESEMMRILSERGIAPLGVSSFTQQVEGL